MKITSLILTGFFVILILFSITTYINYRQSDRIDENSERFAVSSDILRQSNRFQRNMLSMVSGLRGYLLTNESSFIQSYDSAVVDNYNILGELSLMIHENSRQRRPLEEIDKLHTRWVKDFAEPLLNAKEVANHSDSSARSFALLYREKLSDNVQSGIQQNLQRQFRNFTNIEYASREHQKQVLQASVEQTRSISFFLTAFSIIVGMAIAIFLAKHISSGMVRMIEMADAIAAGDYNVQLNDRGNDEVSRLTRSLNNMARMLAENISLLKIKNEELNQFAHIVSHDLKGPLRGIDNVISWIEEDHSLDLPHKVSEYIELIKGRVVRTENLLNGILSYSRVGRDVQYKEVVNINDLMMEVRENLPDAPLISLQIQHPMPTLMTERLPLFQVFSNLVGNAFKYHHEAGGIVKVSYREYGSYYKFFVEDNGPGIAKPYHDKIFMIFQTLQEKDTNESTGIGLAIVKKILTDRKLEIELVSDTGEGAIFAFTWSK